MQLEVLYVTKTCNYSISEIKEWSLIAGLNCFELCRFDRRIIGEKFTFDYFLSRAFHQAKNLFFFSFYWNRKPIIFYDSKFWSNDLIAELALRIYFKSLAFNNNGFSFSFLSSNIWHSNLLFSTFFNITIQFSFSFVWNVGPTRPFVRVCLQCGEARASWRRQSKQSSRYGRVTRGPMPIFRELCRYRSR